LLALLLGLVVSAGLYFAYLWPSIEPIEEEPGAGSAPPPAPADTPAAARLGEEGV
jgi:hypothetical protein